MKIAVRGGHNYQATGASGFLNEVKEDRQVTKYLIDYLKKLGHIVIDVTPGDCDTNSDLVFGVSKANTNKVDLFISIHFNAAYTTTQSMGCECVTFGDTESNIYATRICDKLSNIGFKNRAVKTNKSLYELKNTVMPSVIVEVCFVDSSADATLYNLLTPQKVARAIAEGIANKPIDLTPVWKEDDVGWWYDLGNGTYPKNKWLEIKGEWYFFDAHGYALKETWLKHENKWYYFNKDCQMVKDCILSIKGKYYAFNKDGAMKESTTIQVEINSKGELIL